MEEFNRIEYSRKLIGLTLLVICVSFYLLYDNKFSLLDLMPIVGLFLILEHYFYWKNYDFYDILTGHEWYGIYFILIAFLIQGYLILSILSLIGFILGAQFRKFNPFEKLKEML